VLRGSVEAERDLATLFRAQVVFWLLAATDGHAKNFSLRILPGGRFQLTPLYDILSAWPIIGKRANQLPIEKVRMAMALPGQRPHYHLKTLQRRHLLELAKQLGIGASADRMLGELLAATPTVIEQVQRGLPRGFPADVLDNVLDCLRVHAKRLASES